MNKLLFTLLSSTILLVGCAGGSETASSSSVTSVATSSSVAAVPFAGAINLYTRDTTSGTRVGFFVGIGFDEAEDDNSVLASRFVETGNQEKVAAAQSDPFMIGYVSLSTLNTSLFKGFKFEGVAPTTANVLNGTYKLGRKFNWMLRDSYSVYGADATKYEQLSNAYIAYLSSREGQAIISQGGGIVDLTGPAWTNERTKHPVCQDTNNSFTLKIGGSDSVQSLSQKIAPAFAAACGNVAMDLNHTGSGNAFKGTNGANSAVNDGLSVHVGYASREFNANEPALKKGVMATDAIVAIGHLTNKIDNLTAAQLTAMYKGQITDWRELNP